MSKFLSIDYAILLLALVIGATITGKAAALPTAYAITDLGTLGGPSSSGMGINASGQVTGSAATTDVVSHAFVWTPTTPNGVSGAMEDLGTLGGAQEHGLGINAAGQVTGYAYTTGDVDRHAFLDEGTMHDLGSLGETYSEGRGINDSGQVTGLFATPLHTSVHAFLDDGAMHDLGTFGGTSSAALAVNASGQVTGYAYTERNSEGYAFLYDGALHSLGSLGGTYSAGHGINAAGDIVGDSDLAGNVARRPFLYTSVGGMVDLNSLIDPHSGWELQSAQAINDAGQITGTGYVGGQYRAYLLTPVPEPASLALLALGLPILIWRKSLELAVARSNN